MEAQKPSDVLSQSKTLGKGPPKLILFVLHNRILWPSLLVITIMLTSILINRFLSGLSILVAYILGILSFHSIFRSKCCLPNFFIFHQRKPIKKENKNSRRVFTKRTILKTICPVCGDSSCDRYRPGLNIVAMEELMKLKIPENIDQAIEEFLNLALSNYVYNWYSTLTMDEAFMYELKSSIRHALSVILQRAQEIDLIPFITEKLFKVGLQHVDAYIQATRHFPGKGQTSEEATLNYLGSHQHLAVRSRTLELEYLRDLLQGIMPYITPTHSTHCRVMCNLVREILAGSIFLPAMDVIANPDYVNHMMLVFLSKDEKVMRPELASPDVTFLDNFCRKTLDDDITQFELSQILKDQNLLFPFMQFLKTEGSINILNFCLSVEDFNKKMLNPELKSEELEILHQEANNIFKMFCVRDSPEQIHFDPEIVEELEKIVSSPAKEIEKLRVTPPLFQAYEYAYNLLESMFCPLFPKSDEYFAYLYGSRLNSKIARSISKFSKKNQEPFAAVSKLGNKIKGVFKGSDDKSEDSNSDLNEHFSSPEDELIENTVELPARDLSAWRISIPTVKSKIESGKLSYVFIIEVQRIDVKTEDDPQLMHWKVKRRYNEFYVLENKLIEFHGKFPEIHLPPQKTFGNKGEEFLNSKKQAFEDYLKKLLSTPSLRGSDLLYNFLKSSEEFTAGFLPDINIGKMFKNVPMRLLKGKMQHLDSFIQSFILSTEAPKPKPSKTDICEEDSTPAFQKRYHPLFTHYKDIPALDNNKLIHPDQPAKLNGIYEYLTYAANMVFQVPFWMYHILDCLSILVRNTLEAYFEWYLQGRLDLLLTEQKIVPLIHLLQDAIFFDDSPPRSAGEKQKRADATLKEMLAFLPNWVAWSMGPTKHYDGTKLIFDMLQQPRLNKQLAYALLDLLMTELFPELNEDDSVAL